MPYSSLNGGNTVYDGEYDGKLIINKRISIVGNGSETTTIDGVTSNYYQQPWLEDVGDVVLIVADEVTLDGFTLTWSGPPLYSRFESAGIHIISNNNHFSNISFVRPDVGIICEGNGNEIRDNMFSCDFGVRLRSSMNTMLFNNTFTDGSIRLEGDLLKHWSSHTIESTNTVNGKPIVYLINGNGGKVEPGGSMVILVNCTNMNINGQIYRDIQGEHCILLHSSSNIRIMNNIFENNSFYLGNIHLIYSNSNLITNNSINDSDYGGVTLEESHNNTIIENSISAGFWSNDGINLRNSDDNLIRNNSLINQFYGIRLVTSVRNEIDGNTLSNANYMNCILVENSNDTIITRNILSNNNYGYAIRLQQSNSVTLSSNTIQGYGLSISGEIMNHWSSHTIDPSNTVGNRSIIYLRDQTGVAIPSNAGQIILANCTGIDIRDQHIINTTYGILLAYSTGISIGNSTFESNSYGIYLRNSSGNIIENSIIRSNRYSGLLLSGSHGNTIRNNLLEFNKVGLSLEASDSCSIERNTINFSDEKGILLKESTNIVMLSNNLIGNGIFIEGEEPAHWNSHSIPVTNSIDLRPVYYFAGASDLVVPAGAGQIIISNSTNITVEDQNLVKRSGGLYIGYSNKITVQNVTASNGKHGITLLHSSETILEGNTCTNNYEGGITIRHSPDSILRNNTCVGNEEFGISISKSEGSEISSNDCTDNEEYGLIAEQSDDLLIRDNTCTYVENGAGISLLRSNGSVIEENTCSATYLTDHVSLEWENEGGIYVEDCHNTIIRGNDFSRNSNYGISHYLSSNSTIENNTCSSNMFGSGIYLRSSWNCSITGNTCRNNDDYFYGPGSGVEIESSRNCTVKSNLCTRNQRGLSISTSFDCYINNNDFSGNNQYGIHIGTWFDKTECERNIFIQNDCSHSRTSIDIYGVRNNTFEKNVCSGGQRGIVLSYASGNILLGNVVKDNEDQGFRILGSSDNAILNNTITGNREGFFFWNGSMGNVIENNSIYGNHEYGINTVANASLLINASNNWWGHESGPYHPTENVRGKGNRVVANVQVTPWLTSNPQDGEGGEDDSGDEGLLLLLLTIILVGLVLALVIVVYQPEQGNPSIRAPSSGPGKSGSSSLTRDTSSSSSQPPLLILCQHCAKKFDRPKRIPSIRVSCPHCGKKTISEDFQGSEIEDLNGFDR